jgi:predicted dehydrogenase
MDTKVILLIGVGNLGKRYLEALSKVTIKLEIYLVDVIKENIDKALNLCKTCTHVIHSDDKIPEIKKIDLCIVSTCSDVRKKITEQIINKYEISYLILEKFLFQTEDDYYVIQKLIKEKNIKCWINCPRRTYYFYNILKNNLKGQKIIKFKVIGNNWNMCSNLVHFLDLYTYLTDEIKELELKCDTLFESKRNSYYDMYGTVKSTDNIIEIINTKNTCQLVKEIETKDYKCTIINDGGTLSMKDSRGNYSYTVPYLSVYMNEVVTDILTTGKCELTPYDESMKIHLSVLKIFLEELKKHNINNCQIT